MMFQLQPGVVDHVIIGQKGLYAVNVVARRCSKRTHARLRENHVEFANGKPDLPIVDLTAKTARLQKEFRQLLGHKVRLRSVIAVPGWEIGEQSNDQHLLVNERTIAMLSGWKDNTDYLMNEDVDLLQQELVSRCATQLAKKNSDSCRFLRIYAAVLFPFRNRSILVMHVKHYRLLTVPQSQ